MLQHAARDRRAGWLEVSSGDEALHFLLDCAIELGINRAGFKAKALGQCLLEVKLEQRDVLDAFPVGRDERANAFLGAQEL